MLERGLKVDHSTIGRVDETYIKVNGDWKYLYRAVDSEGNTLDFMLNAKRDKKAAKRFLLRPYESRDLSAGGALFEEGLKSQT